VDGLPRWPAKQAAGKVGVTGRDPRYFLRLFFRPFRLRFFRDGTFLPFRRASESPIAIACLRLFTFFLLRPLRSVPRLRPLQAVLHA